LSVLLLDTETFCDRPIRDGLFAYAEVSETIIIAKAWDDEDVEVYSTEDVPDWAAQLQAEIDFADEVVIHNSPFERHTLAKYGITIPVEKITDTAILALQHGFPAKLETLCSIFELPVDKAKDKAGKALIQLFSKPRPKNMKLRRATRDTHPEKWAEFLSYAGSDVVSMRELHRLLPRWNASPGEQKLWWLDQTINDRGVQIDLQLAEAAVRAAARATRSLADALNDLTDGAVASATQGKRLLEYLSDEHDFDPGDLTKGNIKAWLASAIATDEVKAILANRLEAAATSPAKYKVLMKGCSADGRLRGTLQFCGAARTGRWGGRLFQPQNLPRPTMTAEEIEDAIAAMIADLVELLFDDIMSVCASCVRGAIIAAPGKKLCIADLSNIEGRMLAWLANEDWKLKAFKDYDAGIGHDLYKITAGMILGKDPGDITGKERQEYGKVPELACLAGDTRVLTDRGPVAIKDVRRHHKLWDGTAWVKHAGLIDRGEKPTITVAGVKMTGDHLVLAWGHWLPAAMVASSPSAMSLAKATGTESLLSWRLSLEQQGVCAASASAAVAGLPHMSSISVTSGPVARRAATVAQSVPAAGGRSSGTSTPELLLTTPTGDDFATASRLPTTGATTPPTEGTPTTGGAVSRSGLRGGKIAACFSHIWRRSRDGTILRWKWTAPTSTGGTSPAISGLSAAEKTERTNAPSSSSSDASASLRPVYDIANAGPHNRFTILTDDGALVVHNCGYQGSVGAFAVMGANYGVSLPEEQVLDIVKGWRKKHRQTVNFWYDLERAAIAAIRNPGKTFKVGYIKLRVDDHEGFRYLRIRLPSGRYLCYFQPEVDPNTGKLSYMGIDQYTRQWKRLATYGGKLCIAKGTPVLTERGWVAIEHVRPTDRVWDGVSWVRHAGLDLRGVKEVILAHGVTMTPDHEILTSGGWVRASQSKGLERAPCGLPDGYDVRWEQREEIAMAHSLPVRGDAGACRLRAGEVAQEGSEPLVRVPAEKEHRSLADDARDVQPQGLCGVAVDAGPLPPPDAPSVGALRGQRHSGVPGVAGVFCEILGGHGPDVSGRADAGEAGQQRGVQPNQLLLDLPQGAGPEHPGEPQGRHAVGLHHGGRDSRENRVERDDTALPPLAGGAVPSFDFRPGQFAEVFDLLNCGPLRRFTVLGADGLPLIVHNCENATQAASRDVLAYGMLMAEERGYLTVLHVHDELLTETPDTPDFTSDELEEIMATNPPWAIGLPLAAGGFETYRYRKDD